MPTNLFILLSGNEFNCSCADERDEFLIYYYSVPGGQLLLLTTDNFLNLALAISIMDAGIICSV